MPVTPYTAAELAEFEAIILAKLEEAREELRTISTTMREVEPPMTKEEMVRLAERQAKFIKHLDAALLRIHNRTYGICRITGKPISKERLRLVPHASFAIDTPPTTTK